MKSSREQLSWLDPNIAALDKEQSDQSIQRANVSWDPDWDIRVVKLQLGPNSRSDRIQIRVRDQSGQWRNIELWESKIRTSLTRDSMELMQLDCGLGQDYEVSSFSPSNQTKELHHITDTSIQAVWASWRPVIRNQHPGREHEWVAGTAIVSRLLLLYRGHRHEYTIDWVRMGSVDNPIIWQPRP